MFSPLVEAVYGNEGPVRVSWAIEKETVASGEAEPIDGRSEDSVVSIVCQVSFPGRCCCRVLWCQGAFESEGKSGAISRQRELIVLALARQAAIFHVNKRLHSLPRTSSPHLSQPSPCAFMPCFRDIMLALETCFSYRFGICMLAETIPIIAGLELWARSHT